MPVSPRRNAASTSRSRNKSSGRRVSASSKSKATNAIKLEEDEVLEISSDEDKKFGNEVDDKYVDDDHESTDKEEEMVEPKTPSPKKGSKRGVQKNAATVEEPSSKKRRVLDKRPMQMKGLKGDNDNDSDPSNDDIEENESDDVFKERKRKYDIVGKAGSSKVAYHDDHPTSEEPPETDESNVGTRDPALKSTYRDLVNIRIARMHSWSDKIGNGQPGYSAILQEIPDINKMLLRSAIVFQRSNNFANLSRVDPALISTGHLGQTYLHLLRGGARALTFTSVIIVDSCHLVEPKPAPNSKPVKAISGAVIEGEWERLVGAIGMVIRERDFKAQLFKDNLSFTTAPSTADDSPTSSPMKKRAVFSQKQSPFTRRANTAFSKTTLSFNDIVPIYNACDVREQFPNLLTNLEDLPSVTRDIAPGSCVVVGYTLNTFTRKNDDMKSLSFNVQWVMVLGVAN